MLKADILNLTNTKDACIAALEVLNEINCSSFIIPIEENGNLFPG